MMKFGRIAAVVLVCGLYSLPAWAERLPDGGLTAKAVADVLLSKGFTAQVGTDDHHDPMVSSAAAGAKFTIFFFNCDHAPRCGAIRFFAGYQHKGVSFEKINRWNQDNRFGRAYLSRDRSPNVEMDVYVDKGFTTESLEGYLDLWTLLMGSFQSYIGW
jgi:hypothetical protein